MIAEKDVMDMRRCVIVGGAEIRTYDRVRQYFRPDDFFIYCDCGLRHQKALGAEPDLIVGDFDSHEKPETDRETIVLPVKKDDTDTVFAAKEAMRRGFDEFLLVGVSGGRLDHTLVNVYLLVMLREQGKRALLVDDYSEMELVGAEKVEIPERFPFYSLVNITGTARGGLGIRNYMVTEKTGPIVGIKVVDGTEDLLLVTEAGILIRTAVENIRIAGRATQGVIVMRFKEEGDRVISMALTDREQETEKE